MAWQAARRSGSDGTAEVRVDRYKGRERQAARYADSFAGLEITDRVRVFRKPAASFDAWVRQVFAEAGRAIPARYPTRVVVQAEGPLPPVVGRS